MTGEWGSYRSQRWRSRGTCQLHVRPVRCTGPGRQRPAVQTLYRKHYRYGIEAQYGREVAAGMTRLTQRKDWHEWQGLWVQSLSSKYVDIMTCQQIYLVSTSLVNYGTTMKRASGRVPRSKGMAVAWWACVAWPMALSMIAAPFACWTGQTILFSLARYTMIN
jgi:hypothetical protein